MIPCSCPRPSAEHVSACGRRNEAPRRTREKPLVPRVFRPLHACENFKYFCIFFLRENSSSQNLVLFTYGDQRVLGYHFFLIHTRWKITKLAEVYRERSEIYVTLQRFENCSKNSISQYLIPINKPFAIPTQLVIDLIGQLGLDVVTDDQ